MTLETVTLRLPQTLLRDAGSVASAQDVTIGHLVRQLLAKEVARRINPKMATRADEGLVAALQALLAHDMAEAGDWDELETRLARHGYELRPAGGGLTLHKKSCGTRVCKGSELGFAYRSLVRRFGVGMPDHPHGALGEQFIETPEREPILNSTQKGRLQRALEPVFKTADSWETLATRLHKRGYLLCPIGTELAIYTDRGAVHVCNTATMGFRYRALVKKYGCPMPGHPHGMNWVASKQDIPEKNEPDFEVIERNLSFDRSL